MSKRLFLFAGYDKDGIVDDALVYYVKSLSELGNVIFVGDSDFSNKELNKIKPYTIYAAGKRHGEYDFGSYKRAYQYADNKKLFSKYDYIYMVNDSVYGPTFDLETTLQKMESFGTGAFGLIKSTHKIYAPIESWFVGTQTQIATTKWFKEFITNVKAQKTKAQVTIEYENGLTDLFNQHNISWHCMITVRGRGTYNKVKKLFKQGCPFIKKSSFIRHNGALGHQILYVLNRTQAQDVILSSTNRIYGTKYMNWLLTNNPIKILYRNITYVITKLRNGGI